MKSQLVLGALAAPLLLVLGQDQAFQPEKLRRALKDRVADFWIYEDLPEGYARAKKTGKPLLVCFRCVP